MKKALKIILLVSVVIVLLLASLAVWGYYAFLHTAPLTSEEAAELEVDWTPITHGNWSPWVLAADGTREWNPAKSFNDWLARAPEEDKAWAELLDIRYAHSKYYDNADITNQPMYPTRWAKSVALLDTDEAAVVFDRMLAAFNRPLMGAGISNGENPILVETAQKYGEEWTKSAVMDGPGAEVEMIGVLLPALGMQRNMGDFVLAYSSRRLELREPGAFLDGCSAVMHHSATANEMPAMIGDLVKMAMRMQVTQTIDWAIDQHHDAFTDEQLARLDELLADPELFGVQWQGEALMFEDTVRRFADENGSLSPWSLRKKASQVGSSTLGPATDLPVSQMNASAQRLIYIHQQVLKRDLADVNDPDFASGWSFYQSQRSQLGKFEQLTLDLLLPALSKAKNTSMSDQQYANAVRFAIAARRHQLRHGALPGVGEPIDADLIAGLDLSDPFTGEPLTYQRTEDGFRILPSHPEDEPDVVLWPKQYEPIIEDDEPEYYDWELEGLTEEQKEEMLNSP
ncbi:MAG: hypothetical protein KC996_07420 [Phycisphaerales bacterium]|nr:hypothetical protein [Phycisphaerales bacterium]